MEAKNLENKCNKKSIAIEERIVIPWTITVPKDTFLLRFCS